MSFRVLHLVRHGARDGTEGDPGLNDLGRQQAEHIAARLAALKAPAPVSALVSSPTRRTRETADVSARALPSAVRSEAASLAEGFPAAPPPRLLPVPPDSELLREEALRFDACWEAFFRGAEQPTVEV